MELEHEQEIETEYEGEHKRLKLEFEKEQEREKRECEKELKLRELEIMVAEKEKYRVMKVKLEQSKLEALYASKYVKFVPPFIVQDVDKYFLLFEKVATDLNWPLDKYTILLGLLRVSEYSDICGSECKIEYEYSSLPKSLDPDLFFLPFFLLKQEVFHKMVH